MRCSHGIPYECKCKMCVEEALQKVRTVAQQPVLPATPRMIEDFWVSAYRQTVVQNNY